jgi:undecaprenyl-diphosphatase
MRIFDSGSSKPPIILSHKMDTILELDKDLLIWINSFHSDSLDPIMLTITKTAFWTPLYLLFIYLIFKKLDEHQWVAIVCASLTILLADQITASIMKPLFQRLRPSRDPTIQNLLHLVADSKGEIYRGGLYGFASSHAANTFGISTFMWFLLKEHSRWMALCFLWAIGMTYTRLYLGVHFPGDILVGGFVGVLCGIASYRLFNLAKRKWPGKSNSISA